MPIFPFRIGSASPSRRPDLEEVTMIDRDRDQPPIQAGKVRAPDAWADEKSGNGPDAPDGREAGRRRVAELVGLLIARDWLRSGGDVAAAGGRSGTRP